MHYKQYLNLLEVNIASYCDYMQTISTKEKMVYTLDLKHDSWSFSAVSNLLLSMFLAHLCFLFFVLRLSLLHEIGPKKKGNNIK